MRTLLAPIPRVVDQHIRTVSRLALRRPMETQTARPLAGPGTVVRQIRDGVLTVADPVTVRAAALVQDLAGEHGVPLDLMVALPQAVAGPPPAQLAGGDGEVRRRECTGEQIGCGSPWLVRQPQAHTASSRSPDAENGRP